MAPAGEGMGLAPELAARTKDIVLCTDGPTQLSERELERLRSWPPAGLPCPFTPKVRVEVGSHEKTEVSGVYVAGDAARRMQLVIVGAAEGAMAAFAINMELLKEVLR